MGNFTLKNKNAWCLLMEADAKFIAACDSWWKCSGGAGRCMRHGCVCVCISYIPAQLGSAGCSWLCSSSVSCGRNHIFANMNFVLYSSCSLIHHSHQDEFAFFKANHAYHLHNVPEARVNAVLFSSISIKKCWVN